MPGPVGFNAGGAYIVRPGVSSIIDASAMVPNRPGPGGYVGVVGLADGGAPGTVYEFSSYAEAASVLRRGQALSYIKRIFSPSPDIPGASLVRFVRLGSPTAGTVAAGGMTFTSRDFGRHVNGITVQMAGATGNWTVTIRKASDGYSRTYTVGKGLAIKSTATTPKIVFDHAAKEAKLYENAVVVATMPYPTEAVTISNLAAFINGRAGWTATVTGDGSMPVCYMDNPLLATAPAILATDTAIPASQGQLQWLLATRDPLLSCALTTGSTFSELAIVAETPLASGTGTGFDAITPSDFDAALTLLEAVEVHHLFLCSADASVQAKGLAHVNAMRLINRKRWRIFYTGGAANETSANAIINAQKLDGPAVYAWNGTADAHPETSLPENLGGLGTSAQICGMAAGTPAATPLTNKPVRSTALEVSSPADSTIDALLVAGVSPVAYDPITGRAVLVQAITTWQGGANVAYRKLQGLRIQDEISRGIQRTLSGFVGEPLDLLTGNRVKSAVARFLDSSVRTSSNPDGFLTQGYRNGAATPAWENLQVSSDGTDLWTINVETHPVGESDYILVRVKLTPTLIEV